MDKVIPKKHFAVLVPQKDMYTYFVVLGITSILSSFSSIFRQTSVATFTVEETSYKSLWFRINHMFWFGLACCG